MKIVYPYPYPCLRTVGCADRVISEKANYWAEQENHEAFFTTTSLFEHSQTPPLSQKVTHIENILRYGQQPIMQMWINLFEKLKTNTQ